MKLLFKCLYGSKLYGTNVPGSDDDFKGIYLPTTRELILGHDKTIDTKDESGEFKVEEQYFSLAYWMQLALSQQTICLDMLYVPEDHWVEATSEWLELDRTKLISKNLMPFIGYARSQAIKYGEKGDRLRTLLDFQKDVQAYVTILTKNNDNLIPNYPPSVDWFTRMVEKYKDRDGVKILTESKGQMTVTMLDVVGKSFGNTTSIKLWIEPLNKLVNSFGKRSREAMSTDGHDLKAQYHCVRIIEEARELLDHGKITFPRPEKDLLLSIRKGELSKQEVEALVTEKLALLEASLLTSKLPEKPDRAYAEEWVYQTSKKHLD